MTDTSVPADETIEETSTPVTEHPLWTHAEELLQRLRLDASDHNFRTVIDWLDDRLGLDAEKVAAEAPDKSEPVEETETTSPTTEPAADPAGTTSEEPGSPSV